MDKREDVNPKEGKEKYGNVTFADETNKKYPIDTEEHIRAAWNYIHQAGNADKYSTEDANKIKNKILAAWRKIIGGEPPSAVKTEELNLKLDALQSQLDAIKLGARNSAKDKSGLQTIHDALVEMGASCDGMKSASWSQTIQSMHDTVSSLGADCGEKKDVMIVYGGEVKALPDNKVGGYLIRFSDETNPDLTGDFFQSDTDFGQSNTSPILYNHGMDSKTGTKSFGFGSLKMDEIGIWIEAQLDAADKYAKAIYSLAKKGKLGWSSGTANHLVRRESKGNANKIISWPLGLDASLTPTPAEPRNIAMSLKSIKVTSLEPEAEGDSVAQNVNNKQSQKTKDTKMNEEEKKAAEAKAAEEKRIADEAAQKAVKTSASINVEEFQQSMEQVIGEQIKSNQELAAKEAQMAELQDGMKTLISEAMKAAPAIKGGGANINLKTKRGDSEMQAFTHWVKTGDKGAIKSNVFLNESVVAEGEATVPIDFYNQIVRVLDVESFARAAGARVINTSLHTLNIPIQKNRWAAPASTAESQTSTQTIADLNQVQPFDTVAVTPLKYTRMVLLSDEYVNDDKANVLQFISDSLAQQYALLENTLAVAELTSGVTAHQTAAAAAAIATADVNGLFYKVTQPYRNKGAWVGAGTTQGAIASIQAYPFVYTGSPQGAAGPAGLDTLLGRPFFNAADVTAIAASAKSLWFGNFSYMGLVQNGGLTIRRLNEAYAIYGQVAFLASLRIAFKTLQPEAFAYLVHPTA